MHFKKIKPRTLAIVVTSLSLVVIGTLIACGLLFLPRNFNKVIPDEEIDKVVLSAVETVADADGKPQTRSVGYVLSGEKLGEFSAMLKAAKYRPRHGAKFSQASSLQISVYYEDESYALFDENRGGKVDEWGKQSTVWYHLSIFDEFVSFIRDNGVRGELSDFPELEI